MAVARQQDSASALAIARETLADARDANLASELVLGVLRWQAALDAALAPLSTRPLDDLDRDVLVSLRLAAYQRLFLTRIPASAAVNDAVSLVRQAGRERASGTVNAILRRLDPIAVREAWPARPSSGTASGPALDYLSTTLSHPRWLAARWLDRVGLASAERWERFNNSAAPLTIRPVTWRMTTGTLARELAQHGVRTRPCRFATDGLVIEQGNPLRTPLVDRGVFQLQDEASQLVAQLVVALRPALVLDACAAPGGKTTAIRGSLGDAGRVVACDLRPRRVRLLRNTVSSTDAPAIHVVRADFTRPAPFRPVFDTVLVDAPCSGLGTIRREPEIRWRRHEADLARLAHTALVILRQAAECVSPGGHLAYATCSSEPEENEHVVDAFLREQPDFRRVDRSHHPWAATRLSVLIDDAGDLRTVPYEHDLEAFYAAVLVRR